MPTLRPKADGKGPATFRFDSTLPAWSLLAMVPFLPPALKVKRSLDAAIAAGEGVVTYALVADLRGKEFRVESTWTDEASFRAWVDGDVHRTAMKKLSPRVRNATFEAGPIETDPVEA
jgi:quinol monooxygenase YgiN